MGYRITPLSIKCLQCRLSLRETQAEFAKRFKTHRVTIVKWENGAIETQHPLAADLLDRLWHKLHQEHKLLPEAAMVTILRQNQENYLKRGYKYQCSPSA